MSKVWLALVASLLAACLAADRTNDSAVEHARILAVVASPAEVSPGAVVQFQAVVASPVGSAAQPLHWSFCATARAAGDNTAASPACVTSMERPLSGSQPELSAVLPSDACKIFGSETASGHAPNRADATGGYYQPLRVALDTGEIAIARTRVSCALPSAPLAVALAYTQQYAPNVAPTIAGVRLLVDGVERAADALVAGESSTVRLELEPDARESYLLYEPHSGLLQTVAEQLEVSWYVAGGSFASPRTTVSGLRADNTLRLADGISRAHLWLVLRDDRGGVAVTDSALEIALGS